MREFLLLILFAWPLDIAAQALEPRDIAARARPAAVVIETFANGQLLGQGSGFLVSADGTIITNRHVIEGGERLRVHLESGEIYDHVYLVSDNERRDLAVLRIPATSLPHLPIADDRESVIGDPVFVMGNPLGLEGTFSNGLLSGRRTMDGVALIQISAPISHGSSGGPVLNENGEVIGVATLMYSEGQNLNMAVPARYAAGMIAMHEDPVPFEDVAARFAAAGSPASAANREADADTDTGVDPWLRVLREEVQAVLAVLEENDATLLHDIYYGVLEAGMSEDVLFEYNMTDGTIGLAAVCDIDCNNVDVAVYDPKGNVVEFESEADARSVLIFTPPTSGEFDVRLSMAGCSAAECGYAIVSFAGSR